VLIVTQFASNAHAQSSAPSTEPNTTAPAAAPAQANKWRLQFSPYTYHFNPDTDHRNVVLIGVEREHPNAKLDGAVFFSNSFGQESVYIYPVGGVYKDIFGWRDLSFKWTAGLLYGYKKPYENKVPLNKNGFSPGIILGLSYQITPRWSTQINMLGTAGVMFQVNAELN
jgi:hypothetical protein